jgi:hypothetical protein
LKQNWTAARAQLKKILSQPLDGIKKLESQAAPIIKQKEPRIIKHSSGVPAASAGRGVADRERSRVSPMRSRRVRRENPVILHLLELISPLDPLREHSQSV